MTARTDAQAAHQRVIAIASSLTLPKCTRLYGVAPCTAAAGVGNECYNTYATCQDKANYLAGAVTHKHCSRGTLVPGETVRPYIESADIAPTQIEPGRGLSKRTDTRLEFADEPCVDVEDPYYATRAQPAQGTWWGRLLARNPDIVGKPIVVQRGYVTQPWDWATFQTELYFVNEVRGPDASGRTVLVLSDVLKVADRNVVPPAVSGTLQADVKAIEARSFVAAATSTTTDLAADASPLDGAYVGMELYVEQGVGSGQRRVITAYSGAMRRCTHAAWSVLPEGSSVYQVGALSINVGSGNGAQYPDPATSGKREYICIGDEVVEYTAKSGNVLSWPATTYRAQWGTAAEDHNADDAVVLCRAWHGKRPWEVDRDIFVEAGISTAYLDLAGWESEDTTWLNGAEITAILVEPTPATTAAAQLLQHVGCEQWWDPVAQKLKLLANMPPLAVPTVTLTDTELGEVRVERLATESITRAYMHYALRSATADEGKGSGYLRHVLSADVEAEGPNEKNAIIQAPTVFSRWLSDVNGTFANGLVARRVSRLRNIPARISAKVDPRSEPTLGQVLTVSVRGLPSVTGAPAPTSMRVVKLVDRGTHFDAAFLSTGFAKSRYAVIAPNGQPDYGAATEAQRRYAYICDGSGLMSDGTPGYSIF